MSFKIILFDKYYVECDIKNIFNGWIKVVEQTSIIFVFFHTYLLCSGV